MLEPQQQQSQSNNNTNNATLTTATLTTQQQKQQKQQQQQQQKVKSDNSKTKIRFQKNENHPHHPAIPLPPSGVSKGQIIFRSLPCNRFYEVTHCSESSSTTFQRFSDKKRYSTLPPPFHAEKESYNFMKEIFNLSFLKLKI